MATFTKTDTAPLSGTSDDDLILVDDPDNAVDIEAKDGFDELRLSATDTASYVLGADIDHIERVTIGTGTDAQPLASGNTVHVDAMAVENGLEILGNGGFNSIVGSTFNDSIWGGEGSDVLIGWIGNDTLDGGGFDFASDLMQGYLGDDTYHLYVFETDHPDGIAENLDEGIDTVIYHWDSVLSDTVTLGANLEDAVVRALDFNQTASVNGNELDNVIWVEDPEIAGQVTLIGMAGNDSLTGTDGHDHLEGGDGNDTLVGLDGSDLLHGGDGSDSMAGGDGADVYDDYDPLADTVEEEEGGGGIDLLIAISNSLVLPANFEAFTLNGEWDEDGLAVGNSLGNEIGSNATRADNGSWLSVEFFGQAGDDTISARNADDTLDGGSGADLMAGALGNDFYVVDDAGDDVVEGVSAGHDAVESSISYALPDNVEELFLSGAEGLDGFGNDRANLLMGNSGSNVLDGGLGVDTMAGGLGDDFYLATRGDTVSEAAGQGIDTVIVSANWTLDAYLEDLVLSGFGNYFATGNGAANQIVGNTGKNLIIGAGGADQLFGSYGADTLLGDNGNDILEGEAGNDLLVGHAGIDVLAGGGGNDVLAWDAADAAADDAVNGGAGKDTLSLTTGNLNLTALGQDVIHGIEVVELSTAGANTLKLARQDLLDLSNTSNRLEVAGTSDDKVVVTDGTWASGGTTTIGAQLYDVYTSGAATLLVDADIVLAITLTG